VSSAGETGPDSLVEAPRPTPEEPPATAEPDGSTLATAEPQEPAPATAPRTTRSGWARAGRFGLWTLAVLTVLALVAAALGVWEVRRSWPDYGGSEQLKGLAARVTVFRDDHGIPQVYADNADDLFRAQGYVHAQERFWEMDFRRHVTAGRLSELFGGGQVESDRYLRTMGWRRVAEQEWAQTSGDNRRYLQDYADGVNQWLAQHGDGDPSGTVSLEYGVLGLQNRGYRIEKWDPVDSLAWLKAMAWDLRGNLESEINRAELLVNGLSRDQIEQLYPAYPYARQNPILGSGNVVNGVFDVNAPPASTTGTSGAPNNAVVTAAPALARIRVGLEHLPALVGNNFPGIGSNSWVLSGGLTSTGKPLLANDPHLSPSMPGIWYQMGLHCQCAYNVEGFTFSGVPGVVIGHNARIAWGFTNLDPDVTDLYLEKIEGNNAIVDGQPQPLSVRTETIKVAGGKPVTITIRSSRHGPLLSDVDDNLRTISEKSGAAAIALQWTALTPGRTVDALFAIDKAANWSDFRAAAALFEVPAQNMIYADVDGNIGYQSPGRIPVRGRGDGRWPAPGWDSAYDWKGYIPFAELPSVENPAEGFVVTANQAVIGPQYSHFLTDDWTYGYRSQRIRDLIASATAGRKIGTADIQRMQFDNYNPMAAIVVPALPAVSGFAAKAATLFNGWDFQQPSDGQKGTTAARDSAAAAYYNAFWRHLLALTFDELPAGDKPDGADRWFAVVTNLLADPSNTYWDNKSTSAVERAPQILGQALTDAATELRHDQGGDPAGWRWGAMHTLTLENQSFGTSGIAPIEWLFNRGGDGVSGGDAIVNATGWDASVGYQVDAVPSMRMIVDLSNLDASRWICLTGVSGHAFSPHYNDQFPLWRTGQLLSMPWDRATVEKAAVHTQTLTP
jgi:penicillin amidase